MTLESALTAHGYSILYLGTILEGETFVIISSVLCQTGHLEFVWVVCTAFLGALTGDVVCFLMGRCGGAKFLKKGSLWRRRTAKATRLLKQNQLFIVFSYRFFYGLRAVIPFLIGVTDYSFRRFLLISSAGALVWSITITMVGITCGKIILPFLAEMKHYQILFIGAIGIIGFLVWAIFHKNSD
jgi:membrane protein DedA with SNARE-associated domain